MNSNRNLEKAQAYLSAIYEIVNKRIAAGVATDYSLNRLLNGLSKVWENLPCVLGKEAQK